MKLFSYLLGSLLFWGSLQAQSQDFQNSLGEIFSAQALQHGDRSFLHISVNRLPEDHPYASLVNSNPVYLNYLRTHFTGQVDHEALLALDSLALQKQYIQFLQNDSSFQATLQPWLAHYHGTDVAKDSLSFNQVMNVAVKYFTINRLTEEGYYSGKVCAGINGIESTLSRRRPHVEAFCFTAIRNHMTSKDFPLYDEFVAGIRHLYRVELGTNRAEKLLRAQGALYFYMRSNEILQKLIRHEYEAKKNSLPFVMKLSESAP